MAYLFRNVSVLLLEIDVFKSFALDFVSMGMVRRVMSFYIQA